MTSNHNASIAAGAVVIAALAWVDPLFIPLVLLGPLASGLIGGAYGAPPRALATAWFAGGLLMLVSDLIVNGEDVAFHAGVALVTAAIAAGATAVALRARRRLGLPLLGESPGRP